MHPSSESQPADQTAGDSAEIRPGRRALYKPEDPGPNNKEALEQVIAYLTALQSTIGDEKQRAHPLPGAAARSVLQEKRLSRSGAISADVLVRSDQRTFEFVPGDPRAIFGDNEWAVLSGLVTPTSPETVPGTGLSRRPWRPAGRVVPLSWLILALIFCALSCLWFVKILVAGEHQTRLTAPARGPAASVEDAPGASESALQIARRAINAMHAGDFKKASDLFIQARRQGIVFPGLRYQAALLALTEGNEDAAFGWIDESIAAAEAVPGCLYLRAKLESQNADNIGATDSFAEAVRFAPFDPRSYFFLGEILRRNGHPTQAISQFEQALRCRPSAEDTELISFKWRLAQVETGQDNDFQADLAAKLAQRPVSGDTLLLAAASAINHGIRAQATEYVQRAALVLPSEILQMRLRDFTFVSLLRSRAGQASAEVQDSAPPPEGKILVDPATRSLQEADPANW